MKPPTGVLGGGGHGHCRHGHGGAMGPQPGYDEGVGRRGGRTQPSNARPQADRSCHTRHIAVTCHMSFSKRLQHRRAVGGRQQRQGSSDSDNNRQCRYQRFRSYLDISTSRCAVSTRSIKRSIVPEQQERHSLPQVLWKHKRPCGLTEQSEELRHCEASITRHANLLHPSPHLPNTQCDPRGCSAP